MEKDYIKNILEKKFGSKVKIISFQKRKPSFIFSFDVAQQKLCLKIRKKWYHKDLKEVIGNKDIWESTSKEWKALNYFYNLNREDDSLINFIKPIKCIEEINGIITERINGRDFWKTLKDKRTNKRYKHETLRKIGKGLSFLHEKTKERNRSIKFEQKETDNKNLNEKIKKIISRYSGCFSSVAIFMPGFDIRDIIINKNNDIFFLDPGEIKKDFTYKQIADILVTIKIIYQGSFSFLFRKETKNYEREFLRGYFGDKEYDEHLLNSFVLNRLILQYNHTLNSLRRKKYLNIPILEIIIKRIYIDRFYFREIRKIINELK
jgi:hypothetical protein